MGFRRFQIHLCYPLLLMLDLLILFVNELFFDLRHRIHVFTAEELSFTRVQVYGWTAS